MDSLKEFMLQDPRMTQFVPLLTSTNIGVAVPSFKEEYGDGKHIDLIGTLSHEFFAEKFPDSSFSGVSLDKNGFLKITMNMGAKLVLEENPGDWIEARDFYATF